jgi:predicted N-acyltransferase
MQGRTQPSHWIAEPEFARAIDSHLKQQIGTIDEYRSELADLSPFKEASQAPVRDPAAPGAGTRR